MTAGTAEARRTPPRLLVRTFWSLHRAAYRATGGRFGLSRPEAGRKFGMLRLTSIGRRSGQRRMTMIGYYPDGENLVTLAVNGWADAEPARLRCATLTYARVVRFEVPRALASLLCAHQSIGRLAAKQTRVNDRVADALV